MGVHSLDKREIEIPRGTAKQVLSLAQIAVLTGLLLPLTVSLVIDFHTTALVCIALTLLFMILFVGLKLVLWCISPRNGFGTSVADLDDLEDNAPLYTILVPMYHEAHMIPLLLRNISQMRYPWERLQIILLLEEKDTETQEAAQWQIMQSGAFGDACQIAVVPEAWKELPQGKPRALNYGLELARGRYLTIYDAEDKPEKDQLLKAVAGFNRSADNVACLQAALRFWNEAHSILTRFYRAEYYVHFMWILPGLARLGLILPLGGTSNHFKTQVLREVGGWDPYNVTEDADMAGALALYGFAVQSFDSWTDEEASRHLRPADKQRRRWLKGYVMTGLVYTRHPIIYAREMGVRRWFFYNLFMLGTPFCLIINPFFWAMTIAWPITGSPVITHLWPLPLYVTGMVLMIIGDCLLFYQMVFACLYQDGFSSLKYMLLLPFWWLFTSTSSWMMLPELSVKPHHWNKTRHVGEDSDKEGSLETAIPIT